MDNLRESLGSKSCVFITHRTAPLEYADRVIAIRGGRMEPVSGSRLPVRNRQVPARAELLSLLPSVIKTE